MKEIITFFSILYC